MRGFLQAVAAYYIRHNDEQDLGRYTFVFPNQRSQMFFRYAVDAARPHAQARYMTMAELMEKTAGLHRANANELIVWLYVAYCKVRRSRPDGGEPEDFDRFRYWGEMLLRDFDETDRYLVDRLQLFKNVRDFKEIQSSYLTPDQLEIIRTYWGEDPYWGHLDSAPDDGNDFDRHPFWLRFGSENGRFPLLWQMLSDVYQEFHNILIAHRKCYPGMAFRIAAEKVRGGDLFYIGSDRTCVFIGFSDLSPSELTVMRKLHLMRRAEFFWDYDPVLMGPEGCDMAGRFVGNYIKQMPQPVDLTGIHPATHSVEIISCPTNAGQVPMALDRIRRNAAASTAIVLPDEDLLLPVLTQLDSEEFPSVCVSMSYPQRLTDMASLFAAVVSLQLRVIKRSGGDMEFFRNDVMELLAHPLIAIRYADDVRAIIDYLADNNTYNMPSEGVPTGALAAIFRRVDSDAPIQEVAAYVDGVLRFIADTLSEIPGRGLDRMVCAHLAAQTSELISLVESYPEVTMRRNTFFRMVESALLRSPVPLTSP
ncbi:MAG: hypothetical protein K2M97_03045, partial [Muribaculaceae bacterium]|nr:hypothetical protein [Muribaculaceae bacterium]